MQVLNVCSRTRAEDMGILGTSPGQPKIQQLDTVGERGANDFQTIQERKHSSVVGGEGVRETHEENEKDEAKGTDRGRGQGGRFGGSARPEPVQQQGNQKTRLTPHLR